jgi:hypothetical protein
MVALIHDPVILQEIAIINGRSLGYFDVQEAPPEHRRSFDEPKVLRRKQYGIE